MLKNDNENKSNEIADAIAYYLFDLEMKEDWENLLDKKSKTFEIFVPWNDQSLYNGTVAKFHAHYDSTYPMYDSTF